MGGNCGGCSDWSVVLSGLIATSMLHRNPLPAEDSASRQQTPWAVEVKSNHQKSGHWVEKLKGVAAA